MGKRKKVSLENLVENFLDKLMDRLVEQAVGQSPAEKKNYARVDGRRVSLKPSKVIPIAPGVEYFPAPRKEGKA